MEEILEVVHKDFVNEEVSHDDVEIVAVCFGIYLGQVMLENKLLECGYKWGVENNQPCLAKDEKNKIYPVTKVTKRIKDGKGDNVKIFYDVGMMFADVKLDQQQKKDLNLMNSSDKQRKGVQDGIF